MNLRYLKISLSFPVWLCVANVALGQEGMTNPCHEYQAYVDSGNPDSLMARSFGAVCETVGDISLSNDCMTYFSFTSSFGATSPTTLARAPACDASMPGLRQKVASGEINNNAADMARVQGGDMVTAEAGVMDVTSAAPAVPAPPVAAVSDDVAAAPGDEDDAAADMEFWDTVKNSDTPDMYQAYLYAYPDGLFAPVAQIRIEELQLRTSESVAAPASDPEVQSNQSATELAFWESVKDAETPALLQAYLDAYPNGAFAAIAQIKITQLQQVTTAQPIPDPVVDPAETAQQDVKQKKEPKTAKQMFRRAEKIMKRADPENTKATNRAAKKARPYYKRAAGLGHAGAKLKWAELMEAGLGGAQNKSRALSLYLEAAGQGTPEGYDRALVLLDDEGKVSRVVTVVFDYYKVRPQKALETLNTLSDASIIAVQKLLQREGYYFGGLDADFGPLSEKAIRLYVRGAAKPRPPKVVIVKKYPPRAVTVIRSTPLAAKLQRQLKRVWCYKGAVDGVWGAGSVQAMHNFNRWWGASYVAGQPTATAFNRIRKIRRPVCGVQ